MGYVQLILLVIAIALILIAESDAKKLQKKPVQDDIPTTLVDRGSYLQVVKGRRRIGPIILWAADRFFTKERKGERTTFHKAPKVTVWRESAWHALCIGPGEALLEIDMAGKIIFEGPITSVSHPSGTTVDLGQQGTFRIFWGEPDQPTNSFLGNVDRLGITSRWPGTMYIEWRAFALGGTPIWPQLTYVVQVGPMNIDGPFIVGTDPYIPATFTGNGNPRAVIDMNDDGDPGDDWFELAGNRVAEFEIGETFELVGNGGIPDRSFTVAAVTFDDGLPFVPDDETTRVFTLETIPTAATISGTIEGGVNNKDDGWNAAHMVAELLFEVWPHGAGLDQTDWDMGTLQAMATAVGPDGEALKCSMVTPNAPSVRQALSAIMQDVGFLLPNNFSTAKTEFQLQREPVGVLQHISEEMLVKLPEIKIPMGPKPIDRIIFTFPDETNAFKDMTISVDDDGSITTDKVFRAQNAQIVSTAHFPTAALMSERRSFEALARGGEFTLWANRAARTLIPGTPVTGDGFADVMRLMSVEPNPQSGQVLLTLINDFYGGLLSDFITQKGNTGSGSPNVLPDTDYLLWELPEILARGFQQTAVVAHIRATKATQSHFIYASEDGLTYDEVNDDAFSTWSGGQLNEPMSYEMEQDQGPEFTFLGPDIALVQDLSTSLISWRQGAQVVLFADVNGNVEVCFLKKITLISGSTYRLDGLIRGRYDTTPLDLPSGTKLYIAEPDEGLGIVEAWMTSDVPFHAKPLPLGAGQSNITLPMVLSKVIQLYGKMVRPPAVADIRLDYGVSDATGPGNKDWTDFEYQLQGSAPADDLIFHWTYYTFLTPGTGAGQFPAGNIQVPIPEGTFFLEILSLADAVIRETTLVDNTFTYTRADRIADFAGEPSGFKVRVTQNRGGQRSATVTTILTSI